MGRGEGSRFRLDKRKSIFAMRVVGQWNRFPGKAVAAPFLEAFKPRCMGLDLMDGDLAHGRGMDQDYF